MQVRGPSPAPFGLHWLTEHSHSNNRQEAPPQVPGNRPNSGAVLRARADPPAKGCPAVPKPQPGEFPASLAKAVAQRRFSGVEKHIVRWLESNPPPEHRQQIMRLVDPRAAGR